ncbi:hypothetical protein FHE66_09720 [Georgenia sp. 311]|uniref:hypothetical protein n=1 Tax=Georgenia sp. 311 TaxID=2585134 RepID=UPI0011120358|nr:hypothetical protein [Georgenia sp. 311]TNC17558.1 hypothetical protein FHE66_09720 [Georgenia sp. 311]
MRAGVRVAAVVALVVVLGACGEASPAGPSATPTPTPTPTSLELPTGGATPTSPATDAPGVAAAVADLAEHLGVDPAEVVVVSLQDVTWPDGSLGCPQPGMSYTMAQVPGSRLVLAAQGREFSYHAGSEPVFTRCATPTLAPRDTH